MTIRKLLSNVLSRGAKSRKTILPEDKTDNRDKQLELKFNKFQCIQKKQEERIKQLEQKCLNLEKQIRMIKEATAFQNDTEDENTSSNTISWVIQQPEKPMETNSQDARNIMQLSIQSGGRLKHAEIGDVVYYKAWKEQEKIYFVFVNSDRTKKAINNRTTIIEPFCEDVGDIKSPNNADSIEIVKEGILNRDLQVVKKVQIKYV